MDPWSSRWVVEDKPEVRVHLPVTERRDEPWLTILLGKGVTVFNLPVHESATPPFPHHPLESVKFRLSPVLGKSSTVEYDTDLVRLPTGVVDILLQCGDSSL